MGKNLEVTSLRNGQQVIIHFDDDNIRLPGKLENKSARFLVVGELENTNQKVLVPAFTIKEIRQKNQWTEEEIPNKTILDSQNFIEWNSSTNTVTRTTRLLDFSEIYLLDSNSELSKASGDFTKTIKELESYSSIKTYNFKEEKLETLRERVKDSLRKKELVLKRLNSQTMIQRASNFGVDELTVEPKELTIKEKAQKLQRAINKLNDSNKSIDILTYLQNKTTQQSLDLNNVIWQKELLFELKNKTGIDLTLEGLEQFKIEIIVEKGPEEQKLPILQMKLGIIYKENGKEKSLISDEINANIRVVTPNHLLLNSYSAWILFKELMLSNMERIPKNENQWFKIETEKIKELIKELITAIEKEKAFNNLNNETENELTAQEFEKEKQIKLQKILDKIKLINDIQKINYFQNTLLKENQKFLIENNVFVSKNNLNFKNINQNSLLNTGLISEFVEIYQLGSLKFTNNSFFKFYRLFNALKEYQKIKMAKLLGTISDTQYEDEEILLNDDILKLQGLNYNEELQKLVDKLIENQNFNYIEELQKLNNKKAELLNFDRLMHIFLDTEEHANKFKLEESFILSDQLEEKPNDTDQQELLTTEDLTKKKFDKVLELLENQQFEFKLIQETLETIIDSSREKIAEVEKIKRIGKCKFEKNDLIGAYLQNIDGINEKDVTLFKVLSKNKDKFIVLCINPNNEKMKYKIREIKKENVVTILPKFFPKEDKFPTNEELLQEQEIINDYIEWKEPKLVANAKKTAELLQNLNNPALYISTFNDLNISEDWEWEINIKEIKKKLFTNASEELKESIENGLISFDFTEETKEKIKKMKNINNIELKFNITGKTEFNNITYSITTANINFRISKDNTLHKERLKEIRETINLIKEVAKIDTKKTKIIQQLIAMHNKTTELLEIKQEELQKLSNHTNLSVHKINQEKLNELTTEITSLQATLNVCKDDLSNINTITEDQDFNPDYLNFIKYYGRASEATPQNYKKYLYWSKNYNIIKAKLNEKFGVSSFEQYARTKAYNFKEIEIRIARNQEAINQIREKQFKKLSLWQRFKNTFSWTWKKTKEEIKTIKSNDNQTITRKKEEIKQIEDSLKADYHALKANICKQSASLSARDEQNVDSDQWMLEEEMVVNPDILNNRPFVSWEHINDLDDSEESDSDDSSIPEYNDINIRDIEFSTERWTDLSPQAPLASKTPILRTESNSSNSSESSTITQISTSDSDYYSGATSSNPTTNNSPTTLNPFSEESGLEESFASSNPFLKEIQQEQNSLPKESNKESKLETKYDDSLNPFSEDNKYPKELNPFPEEDEDQKLLIEEASTKQIQEAEYDKKFNPFFESIEQEQLGLHQ